jgi:hypothetical protein
MAEKFRLRALKALDESLGKSTGVTSSSRMR